MRNGKNTFFHLKLSKLECCSAHGDMRILLSLKDIRILCCGAVDDMRILLSLKDIRISYKDM